MRTIEKTIYNFNELSKEVQEKLIEKEIELQYRDYLNFYLCDDMEEKASNLINDYFYITSDYLRVYYDLSYSQCGGAMVEFNITIEDINKKYNILSSEEIRFITDKNVNNNVEIRHNGSMYNHEYTFDISYYYYNAFEYNDIKTEYNITEKEFNTIADRIYDILDCYDKHNTKSPFINDIINMNKELTKIGYEITKVENVTDRYSAIDSLEQYEYYKNGEVYVNE